MSCSRSGIDQENISAITVAELLLEILSEEIPARMQAQAAAALDSLVCDGLEDAGLKFKTSTICCYPTDKYFIQAHKDLIMKKIKNLENYKLIFSAHGLPKKNIKKGDPYQWQVEQSVDKIVKSLNIENLDWVLSYQSRVGPLKWIGPSTEDIIIENSKLGKHIVLVPIAFVSEHSETLVELDIEYKKLAEKNGCSFYKRVPALGIEENFIKGLTELVLQKETRGNFVSSVMCPDKYKKCPCLAIKS